MDRNGYLQYTETKSCLSGTAVEFARFRTRFLILDLKEAKTSQKVPKWIKLVIYSTERLRAFLGLLTVEPIQKFNYLDFFFFPQD